MESLAPASSLTEEEVKRRFVSFLRDFYRKRYEPQTNTIQTSLDNVGEGGVVADGMIRFKKNDGTPFTCTYEATSRDKAAEVKYELNRTYFLWDCASFAAVCAAFLYIFFYVVNLPWLISLRAAGNLGFWIGVAMIGFFGWYYTMAKWRKYRYIYAVEQFKQYEADEQWIAIAEDVFPGPTDPYLIELKNQCIYNGFGLATVLFDGSVRVLNAPSRQGVFGKNRRMVHWVTRAQWYQGLSTAAKNRPQTPDSITVLWNKILRPAQYLLLDPLKKYGWMLVRKPYAQTSTAYTRFMKGQRVQKIIFLTALGLSVYFSLTVLQYKKENMADVESRHQWQIGKNPEDQPGYKPNDQLIPNNGISPGVPKQYPTAREEEEVPTINLSGDDEAVPTINLSGNEDKPAPDRTAVRNNPPPKPVPSASADRCDLLRDKRGWIVQDNVFSTRAFAQDRVAVLQQKGLPAAYTANACVEPGKAGYVVWIGAVQSSVEAAKTKAADYQKALLRYGQAKGKLLVHKL